MNNVAVCPSRAELVQLLGDGGDGPAEHVAACPNCQRLLEAEALGDTGWLAEALRTPSPEVPVPDLLARRLAEVTSPPDGPPADTVAQLETLDDPILEQFIARPAGERPRLGPYEIVGVLGRGGMGVVLQGYDPSLRRAVALKLPALGLRGNEAARQRFLREARAAAAIDHPHAVPIHGVEEWAGVPVLVMAFIQGESLQGRLDRDGPLGVEEAVKLTLGVAEALAAAHAAGLVHRDVKPANILLQSPTGFPKLTDFGLARAADDPRVTRTGIGAGTPAYMSPEQASGLAADERSDLFSLGSVLYAALAGRPPFPADTPIGTLRRIAEGSPEPIRDHCPNIPRHLEAFVMDLLGRDPNSRPATARAVVERLRQCLTWLAEGVDPAPVRRRRGFATVLALAVMGLGTLAFAGTVLKFPTPQGTLVVEIDDPEAKVSYDVDGKEVTITGVGVQEIKLRPGQHKLKVTPGRGPEREELVTISRNGKAAVKVTLEPSRAARAARSGGIEGHPNLCPAVKAHSTQGCSACHSGAFDWARGGAGEGGSVGMAGTLGWVPPPKLAPAPLVPQPWVNSFPAGPPGGSPSTAPVIPLPTGPAIGWSSPAESWEIDFSKLQPEIAAALGVKPRQVSPEEAQKRWEALPKDKQNEVTRRITKPNPDFAPWRSGMPGSPPPSGSLGGEGQPFGRAGGGGGSPLPGGPPGPMMPALSGGIAPIPEGTAKPQMIYGGAKGPIRALALINGGKWLVGSTSWPRADETLHVWDVATGAEVRTKSGFKGDCPCLVTLPGDKTFASGHQDGKVRVWDIDADKPIREIDTGSTEQVVALALSPDKKLLAAGGWGKDIAVFDVNDADKRALRLPAAAKVRSLAFTADNASLLVGDEAGKVSRIELATGKTLWAVDLKDAWVEKIVLVPGEDKFVALTRTVSLCGLGDGQPIVTLGKQPNGLTDAAISADGKRLVTVAYGGQMSAWEVKTLEKVGQVQLTPGGANANAVTFAPDGNTVFVGCGGVFLASTKEYRPLFLRAVRVGVPAKIEPTPDSGGRRP